MEIVYDYFTVHGAGICSTHQEIHRLSDEAMAATLNAYVEFMVVKALAQDTGSEGHGGSRLAASSEVEDLWRTHLLCTEKYSSFMESINKVNPFVDFVHFDPHWVLESEEAREMRTESTRKAYSKLFGKPCGWLNDNEPYQMNYKNQKDKGYSVFEAIAQKVRGTRSTSRSNLPAANKIQKSFNPSARNQATLSPTPKNSKKNLVASRSDTAKEIEIRVVSTTANKTTFLTINPADTVHNVKELLQNQEGTPVEQQRLLFAGYELEDHLTAADYGMQNGSRIFS